MKAAMHAYIDILCSTRPSISLLPGCVLLGVRKSASGSSGWLRYTQPEAWTAVQQGIMSFLELVISADQRELEPFIRSAGRSMQTRLDMSAFVRPPAVPRLRLSVNGSVLRSTLLMVRGHEAICASTSLVLTLRSHSSLYAMMLDVSDQHAP